MTVRRLAPGLAFILLVAMGQSAYGATAAELRRAVEIQRRIGALARDQAAITSQLSRVDEAISSATSETVRASLETERRHLQSRLESNARERATLRAEFEALPPL
jgi:septal ring factor EnvC (AmiA/AmiB activator)